MVVFGCGEEVALAAQIVSYGMIELKVTQNTWSEVWHC